MSDLALAILDARAEPHAAVPTLMLRLLVTERSGEPVHTIVLRAQVQIEPRRRHYTAAEERRLVEVLGEPHRWGETLHPLLWTHASIVVPGFQGKTELDLPIACSYDLELAAGKYFHALDDGEIPLRLLFSGTVFARTETGFHVHLVPWDREATYRLPVRVWRSLMDSYYPGGVWIQLRRDTVDALQQFKARRAAPTWDDAITALLPPDAAVRADAQLSTRTQ